MRALWVSLMLTERVVLVPASWSPENRGYKLGASDANPCTEGNDLTVSRL